MEKGRIFEAFDDNGNIIDCETIMSYVCEENGQCYIFYTDNNYSSDGSLNLFASRYMGEEDGKMLLEEITDEREWNLLDSVLEKAKEELE